MLACITKSNCNVKKTDLTTLDRGIYFRGKSEESYPLIGKSMAEIQTTL